MTNTSDIAKTAAGKPIGFRELNKGETILATDIVDRGLGFFESRSGHEDVGSPYNPGPEAELDKHFPTYRKVEDGDSAIPFGFVPVSSGRIQEGDWLADINEWANMMIGNRIDSMNGEVYRDARLVDGAAPAEQPPVDNAHVAPGCEPFKADAAAPGDTDGEDPFDALEGLLRAVSEGGDGLSAKPSDKLDIPLNADGTPVGYRELTKGETMLKTDIFKGVFTEVLRPVTETAGMAYDPEVFTKTYRRIETADTAPSATPSPVTPDARVSVTQFSGECALCGSDVSRVQVVLDLSEQEAIDLHCLLGRVSGDPKNSVRRVTGKVFDALLSTLGQEKIEARRKEWEETKFNPFLVDLLDSAPTGWTVLVPDLPSQPSSPAKQ
jgi:hypothetical protein